MKIINLSHLYRFLLSALLIFCHLSLSPLATAQEVAAFAGEWVFNEDLSDVTDRRVEASLKAAGEKIKKRWFDRSKDRYRGGPPEQELYDHISYDQSFTIDLSLPAYHFTYENGFQRPVYTDNRRRSVSLNRIDEVEDFSFAHWLDGKLLVEARPRDGGFADETYSLINDGAQLRVEMYIKPKVFQVPIEIVRVFDRKVSTTDAN